MHTQQHMFLVSWAKIARPMKPTTVATTSAQPCFRRSLLIPRRPLCIQPSLDDMYVPINSLPPPSELEPKSEPDNFDSLISRIYYITADQLCRMQSLASSSLDHIKNRTKLESFSAFLWKMVAMATSSTTTGGGKRLVVKMDVVVDGRKRLSNGDKSKEAMMDSYFGNVVSIPFGGKPVEDLVEKSLSWVTEEVHKFLETAVTEEHFLGVIDWVEKHRPSPVLARIYCGNTTDVGPALVVSSGQRFPESEFDFGWGKPVFGSYHFPWGGDAGYVMPMPSPKRNGDWVFFPPLRISLSPPELALSHLSHRGVAVALCLVIVLHIVARAFVALFVAGGRSSRRKKIWNKKLVAKDSNEKFVRQDDTSIMGVKVEKSAEFSYEELANATNNFNLAKKIGQGGFGEVYYGELNGEDSLICRYVYGSVSPKIDVYAFRVVLYELISGKEALMRSGGASGAELKGLVALVIINDFAMELLQIEKQLKDEARREALRVANEERKKLKAEAAQIMAQERKIAQQEFRETLLKEGAEKLENWRMKVKNHGEKMAEKKELLRQQSSKWIDEANLEAQILESIVSFR
ncbi:shikimate O-hydroxycinnamoyltransferase-like [Arachis hypogaea]|nr:shikimate O-hydroxycinnamoyltransferase-like [Arachis hypogaea]